MITYTARGNRHYSNFTVGLRRLVCEVVCGFFCWLEMIQAELRNTADLYIRNCSIRCIVGYRCNNECSICLTYALCLVCNRYSSKCCYKDIAGIDCPFVAGNGDIVIHIHRNGSSFRNNNDAALYAKIAFLGSNNFLTQHSLCVSQHGLHFAFCNRLVRTKCAIYQLKPATVNCDLCIIRIFRAIAVNVCIRMLLQLKSKAMI